ncbi:PEP-CTERM sorting domain-containing protein [Roseateles toxinivorans]|uniref:Putative secreted protein with PEP-CTERM sorting signal n=1 Tax=Roseateles toxinivorans TaxID=270368 RepID=A0A4R6QTQ0_9BURK|nr:PEP-CTERM sorting domain-containing protein [Roseateles toxinivorans]TDP74954.1 putative secreted protein with PEP-CTERM sorting signal [Roseateles toxinivorans]
MHIKNFLGLAVLGTAMFSAAQAAPVLEDKTRAGFEASLSAKSGDGFESVAVGTDGVASSFQLIGLNASASLRGTSQTFAGRPPTTLTGRISNTAADGRYNTTPNGSQWWESALDFTVMFGGATQAFGFNLIDFQDFGGTLTLDFLRADSSLLASEVVATPTDSGNGNLEFVGAFDKDAEMYGVRFSIKQSSSDFTEFDWLGFDDLVIGSRAPRTDVPEPGSLALVGISLLGLAAARRKARR